MVLSNNRTQTRWPLFQRFLAIACILIFIPFSIAALVVIGLIPVYLNNHGVQIRQSTDAPQFNVTYLLIGPSTRELNYDSIDRVKMARSFEHALGLKVRNILQIMNIVPNTAIGDNSKSRRKRFVQCDRSLNGPVLIIDFSLTYPRNRICQSQKCVDQTFAEVYQRFQFVLSLFVDFNNLVRELRLCSFGVIPYTAVSNIGTSNTVPSSNGGSNISTSASILNNSSTAIPAVNVSSSTVGTASTPLPNVNASSTATSATTVSPITGTISSTKSSNSTSNNTDDQLGMCLRKLPITQESVPPYRITHTSTIFFEDDPSIIVAGASKFETFIEMDILKRKITINGVLVYNNCQRTIDITIPTICYRAISS